MDLLNGLAIAWHTTKCFVITAILHLHSCKIVATHLREIQHAVCGYVYTAI